MGRYLSYFFHVVKHKWLVGKELMSMGYPLLALTHDLSKFSPSEFVPYAKMYYDSYGKPIHPLIRRESTVMREYKEALLHHYHHNKHHAEFWAVPRLEDLELVPIPLVYLDVMVADWFASGSNPNSKPLAEWWEEASGRSLLTVENKDYVSHLISSRYGKEE